MRRLRGSLGCLAVVLAGMSGCSDSGQEAREATAERPGQQRSALLVGTPELVRDIRPTPPPSALASSHPESFVAVGTTRFFVASDPLHGAELWKTDGTSAGTVLVKDIVPGREHGSLGELTAADGVLYFLVRGVSGEYRLWRSDGTAEGTGPVFTDPAFQLDVQELEAVGGTLYLSAASERGGGSHLWTSDGTREGTRLVKAFRPVEGSAPGGLRGVGGTLYFTADDGVHGRELWKSNGTPEGTVLVKDLVPGTRGSTFWELAAAGDVLYFNALGVLGKSDGTPEGTVLLTNAPGVISAPDGPTLQSLRWLRGSGGTLYFAADDGTSGVELWKSDGSPRGTVRVKDLHPSGSSSPASLVDVNGVLLFHATDPENGRELWRSDGTPEGTVRLTDIAPGAWPESLVGSLAVAGSRAYFFASRDGVGSALWTSDGTPAGTRELRSLAPERPLFGVGAALGTAEGSLLFVANDGVHGFEPWKTDGSPEGTVLLRDIHRGAHGSAPRNMMELGAGRVLFSSSVEGGLELWSSDGTEAGTRRLQEGLKSFGLMSWRGGGVRFFTASRTDESNSELWRSDGTPEGTFLLQDFRSVGTVQVAAGLAGRAFFSGYSPTEGTELWASDGTPEGTVRVKDIHPGSSSLPYQLFNVGGTLYFTADDGVHGRELWKTDGTAAGTVLVKELVPGSGDASVGEMENLNGTLVFTASDVIPTGRNVLWRLGPDGQPRKIPLSAPGVTAGEPERLRVVNGTLLVFTHSFVMQPQLWAYDGTSEGATLLAREQFYYLIDLAVAGRVLYFLAGDGLGGEELWRSDGTAAGTFKVKDSPEDFIDSSYFPSIMQGLADRGQVLLRSWEGATGVELWASDGSGAGTTRVADLAPGPPGSDPRSFARSGNNVFFSADDGVHGAELWRLTLPPVPPDTTLPVLVCPPAVTVEATSRTGAIASWPGARVSDDVSASIPLTYSHLPDREFPLGRTLVTVTARDEAGNEAACAFDVRVRDSTAPTVTCPADVEVEATGTSTPVTFGEATASDGVMDSPEVTYSHARGSAFPVGGTVVTATATDAAGNTASCTFRVTVKDTAKPTVTCPEAMTVEATGPSGAPVTYAATDEDTASPVSLAYSPASGSVLGLGTTVVTATAKDAAGNEATCSFSVRVRDTTAPAITCPADVEVEATGTGTPVTFGAATASDAVTASPEVTYSPARGSAFPMGGTVVTATAKDTAGNTASCAFRVTVRDTTKPSLTCPAAFTVEATTGLGTRVTYEATAEDTLSPVTLTYSPASGTVLGLGSTVVTVTAKDAAGNEATCSFPVLVRDGTAPTLTCPGAMTVEASGPSGAPVTFAATVGDAVTPSPEVTYSHAPGSTFPVGESAVSVTARDTAGNASSCSFSVVVRDTTAPVITCPADVTVVARGPSGSQVVYPAATVGDSVTASPEVTYSLAPGSAFPVGTTPITATVEDAAGNTASCSFRVTVNPVIVSAEGSGSGCAAAGGSPVGLLGLLLLLAWPSLGRAWTRRG